MFFGQRFELESATGPKHQDFPIPPHALGQKLGRHGVQTIESGHLARRTGGISAGVAGAESGGCGVGGFHVTNLLTGWRVDLDHATCDHRAQSHRLFIRSLIRFSPSGASACVFPSRGSFIATLGANDCTYELVTVYRFTPNLPRDDIGTS